MIAMKIALAFLVIILCSCETNSFDSDKRQIMAKDAIRRKVQGEHSSFTVTGFKEDTLLTYGDTLIKKPLRYTLYFTQQDSITGQLLQRSGVALFTNRGNSLLSLEITDQQP